ncbi:hypothetical protein ANN_24611 [Periplaneta americana]|uniref:Uncharacterized protein n=1 Tax=Periplaneta americana TaxID=6978 RepID=A0ABQ8S3U8_PERAM|nr:hypothetical protein ANN_24611 [Periplaneta americana]
MLGKNKIDSGVYGGKYMRFSNCESFAAQAKKNVNYEFRSDAAFNKIFGAAAAMEQKTYNPTATLTPTDLSRAERSSDHYEATKITFFSNSLEFEIRSKLTRDRHYHLHRNIGSCLVNQLIPSSLVNGCGACYKCGKVISSVFESEAFLLQLLKKRGLDSVRLLRFRVMSVLALLRHPRHLIEHIPNLSTEQSDGIMVLRISPLESLMLHRCRTGAISLQSRHDSHRSFQQFCSLFRCNVTSLMPPDRTILHCTTSTVRPSTYVYALRNLKPSHTIKGLLTCTLGVRTQLESVSNLRTVVDSRISDSTNSRPLTKQTDIFSINKVSNISRHYERYHKSEYGHIHGNERCDLLQNDNNALSESAMRISYKICHEIAKELKTFNEVAMTAIDPSSSFVPIPLQRDVIVVYWSGEIRNTLFDVESTAGRQRTWTPCYVVIRC